MIQGNYEKRHFIRGTKQTNYKWSVLTDLAIQVGGAGEGQLFGLKIYQLKFGKLPIEK